MNHLTKISATIALASLAMLTLSATNGLSAVNGLLAQESETQPADQTQENQPPAKTEPADGAGDKLESENRTQNRLTCTPIENLPDELGVAGPIVGVHNGVIIVAGGANFAAADDPQLWELPKLYHDRAYVLEESSRTGNDSENAGLRWRTDTDKFRLSVPVGYSSVVSTDFGVLSLGGENSEGPTDRAFLLSWNPSGRGSANQSMIVENDLSIPNLPLACTGGGAAIVDGYVYVVAGLVSDESGVKTASRIVWRASLTLLKKFVTENKNENLNTDLWEEVAAWPSEGPARSFPLVAAQHDGFKTRLFVFGGRRFLPGTDPSDARNLKFSGDCWSFDPAAYEADKYDRESKTYLGADCWKQLAEAPVPLTAGTMVPLGPAHLMVVGYASGSVLKAQLDSGKPMEEFQHPGFPKTAYAYHTITDTWAEFGELPANQVTTPAVRLGNDIIVVSGEVRPRVRSNAVWRIRAQEQRSNFGSINLMVVILYLIAMLGIGVFFTFRNRNTDDYFRGGKNIPWWAAGCSIFATMLSSITYMAIPAKAFAQDWVYSVGNFVILLVAPIAIYVALPFFRQIDVTSAYEYLEQRFNRTARWIGSASFSLFHVFRMGVVLALAALALASITPLDAAQCVIVMGVLSIVYCTLGGIEAVIWTDTIQTIVLLGGAALCLFFAVGGSDPGSYQAAQDSGKFHMVNFEFGADSFTMMAIWVVIIGSFGQNVASYTSDQAVIQRYMTTSRQTDAARSIWLNGLMAIPSTFIFFGMGTAFWMFYRSHPEKLNPNIAADRIMPLFISQELPIGLAGLVVAGIFAAAQSTVSTSMNSGATTIVTDFLRPLRAAGTEKGFLWIARLVTLIMGVLGTCAGLLFVNPDIKSLFDQFIGLLGMFLGVLAGLFALGATTRRASGTGSLIGAITAIAFMICLVFAAHETSIFGFEFRLIFEFFGSKLFLVSGYLYAFIGISICYVVGYFASFVFPRQLNMENNVKDSDKVKG